MLLISEGESVCKWSAHVREAQKRHHHSLGLIRSQAKPFIVWRRGELERRRFALEPSLYFKVYLCEGRQFIALLKKKKILATSSLTLKGICSWQ